MNFQNELSKNALLSGEIAEKETNEKNRLAQSEAESRALDITANIKTILLENVRKGKYSKQYNKGTAECYVAIPYNRYLKLHAASSYNRKNIRTSLNYQFGIKPEHAVEFEQLKNILNTWGRENQVNISWVVRESERVFDYPFPCNEYHPFPPNRFGLKFQLSVKAVTHFPVDPNLPIDYMSADDIADKEKKTQARIEYKRIQCAGKRKEFIMFTLLSLLFAFFSVVCFVTESYGWILLELFMSVLFGIAVYSSYTEYRTSKANLENESLSE